MVLARAQQRHAGCQIIADFAVGHTREASTTEKYVTRKISDDFCKDRPGAFVFPPVTINSNLKTTLNIMKIISSLRALLLLSSLAAVTSAVQASDLSASVASRLASQGEIPVRQAGPYIEVGSYRIWVESHLGRPASVLPDGTWLYRNYQVDDSQVGGTLAVSFHNGKVATLMLLSNARVAELKSHQPQTSLIASR